MSNEYPAVRIQSTLVPTGGFAEAAADAVSYLRDNPNHEVTLKHMGVNISVRESETAESLEERYRAALEKKPVAPVLLSGFHSANLNPEEGRNRG